MCRCEVRRHLTPAELSLQRRDYAPQISLPLVACASIDTDDVCMRARNNYWRLRACSKDCPKSYIRALYMLYVIYKAVSHTLSYAHARHRRPDAGRCPRRNFSQIFCGGVRNLAEITERNIPTFRTKCGSPPTDVRVQTGTTLQENKQA